MQIAYGLPVFDIFFKMFCHGAHGVTDVERVDDKGKQSNSLWTSVFRRNIIFLSSENAFIVNEETDSSLLVILMKRFCARG